MPPDKRPSQSPSSPSAADHDVIGQRLCERVKALRKKKGWTLEQMSAACGVSRSMLSQIERRQANPTLAVAYRIARALEMSLGDLVDGPGSGSTINIIRAEDRTFHYRSDQHCKVRTLSPLHLEKDVEFYELTIHQQGALRSAPHFQGAREFLTVQQGLLRVESGDDACELAAGDSAHYRADLHHAIINTGDNDAVAFLVVTYHQV